MSSMEAGKQYIMNTYSRFPIVLEKGDGMYVYDENGKKYLDFVAGIAVNTLGHGNEKLASVLYEQARKLIHVSNLYYNEPQIRLAAKLVANGCFDKAFFCNSGAEAVEGTLKLSRKYADKNIEKNGTKRFEIIAMNNSFHGRTYGAITATGQEKYRKGLSPLLPGVKHVEFNDYDALATAVTADTAAIILEPVQGEGGIHPADVEYLKKVRKLCDEKDIMLIFDEVQCGAGRTGYLYAYQYFGVEPDVLAMAKGTAGGVPIGVILAKDKFADAFSPGDHASTFGGNPLATAAANYVIDELLENGLLENVKEQGIYLTQKLSKLKTEFPQVKDVRGVGLLQGIELTCAVSPVISECMERGLLLLNAGTNIIRFVPPLIVRKQDIDEMIDVLGLVLREV